MTSEHIKRSRCLWRENGWMRLRRSERKENVLIRPGAFALLFALIAFAVVVGIFLVFDHLGDDIA